MADSVSAVQTPRAARVHDFQCQKCGLPKAERTSNWGCDASGCNGRGWSSADRCFVCQGSTWAGFRHHCRLCGHLVCSKDSAKARVPECDAKPVPVCTLCLPPDGSTDEPDGVVLHVSVPGEGNGRRLTSEVGVFEQLSTNGHHLLICRQVSPPLVVSCDQCTASVEGRSVLLSASRFRARYGSSHRIELVSSSPSEAQDLLRRLRGTDVSPSDVMGPRLQWPTIAVTSRVTSSGSVAAVRQAVATVNDGMETASTSGFITQVALPIARIPPSIDARTLAILVARADAPAIAATVFGRCGGRGQQQQLQAVSISSFEEDTVPLVWHTAVAGPFNRRAIASDDAARTLVAYAAVVAATAKRVHREAPGGRQRRDVDPLEYELQVLNTYAAGINRESLHVAQDGRPVVRLSAAPPIGARLLSVAPAFIRRPQPQVWKPRDTTSMMLGAADAFALGTLLHILWTGRAADDLQPSELWLPRDAGIVLRFEDADSSSDERTAARDVNGSDGLTSDLVRLVELLLAESPRKRADTWAALWELEPFMSLQVDVTAAERGEWPFADGSSWAPLPAMSHTSACHGFDTPDGATAHDHETGFSAPSFLD